MDVQGGGKRPGWDKPRTRMGASPAGRRAGASPAPTRLYRFLLEGCAGELAVIEVGVEAVFR